MITTLYTRENGKIEYDSSVPCIIATHIGFWSDEEFKSFLNIGLELMIEKKKEQGKIAWLADASKMGANTSEEWAVKDWNPRALLAGVQYLAFVVSEENPFGKMRVDGYDEINKKAIQTEKMTTAMFEDLQSAKNWLREKLKD
ncbi:MAG TPA: hypothetical protein VIM65_13750 [Cyclobacteriaceae bacterium]